ncbi:MAG TPA: endonuclease, partial [Salinivirga sp.]|uniref:endonuclease n=1 Tax=Salinivirga sp. TaxID=1970192 RepID=UPI002B489DCA
MRNFYLFVAFSFITMIAGAQVPSTYYDGISGTGYTLKTNLHNLIDGQSSLNYGDLYGYYESTDNINISGTDYVYDMYSIRSDETADYFYQHISADQCVNYSAEGDCYNREHSMPQSWFNENSPMKADLFHVFPTDGYVNGRRSNYPFGEVGTASWTSSNGSKVGDCSYPGYTGTVFEPIDEFKGDLARAYFYMATRYQDIINTWSANSTTADDVLNETTDQVFEEWFLNMLIEWHQNDPVSQKELDRNDAVYDIQGNANPFIDHPEWVTEIWGGGTIDPEPDNQPTAFSATASAYDQIDLSWTDATGTNLPDGYLIKANTTGTFSAPSDGTDPSTDSDLSDGTAVVKVSHGSQSYSFTGLNGETTYYFKVWSYANSGTDIDFKLDGTPPEGNATTPVAPTIIEAEDFSTCPDGWTSQSIASDADWTCGSGYTSINAYNSSGAADDYLISPALNLDNYTGEIITFRSLTDYSDTYYPPIELLYSTNYSGDASTATWTSLSPTWSPENSLAWTSSGNVDLSGITGSSVYIAFRYTSSGTGGGSSSSWAIDDISITGYAAGPSLSVSSSSLTGYTYEEGSGPSSSQSFDLSGTDLDGSEVTISAPTNYEISLDNGTFSTSETVTYSGTSLSATTIYVRLKAGLAIGTYNSENVTCSDDGTASDVTVSNSGEVTAAPDPQPTNQPTLFTATANGSDQIDLGWTDADAGSQEPAGYLIKANETGTFSDPSDGTDPAEDTDLSDGSAVVKVAHGSGASYSFTGLSAETQYYFKIWSYTNSGTDVDFKIDGTPPTANATTDAGEASSLIISEVTDPGDVANAKYIELYNATSSSINLTDWQIRRYANGSTSSSNVSLSGTIASGDTYVVGNNSSDFETSYGFAADDYNTIISGNGDDVYELYDGSSVVDVYGSVGTDGTGEAWEYVDSRAVRSNTVCSGNTIWTASEWAITAANTGDMTPGDHTCDCPSANDSDSYVSTGGDAEPAIIASTVDADGEEIQVFDFTFTDAGTSDGLTTIIDEIQITQGSANDVGDWTNAIAGAYLNGSDVTDLAGTVNSTNITFASNDMISITDGGNETYTLKIYLKTDLSGITDNNNLEFALDYNNITADASGSSFGSGAPESGDANVAVDITATQLLFVQQPTNTEVSTAMSPNPTVKACDANGNIDVDYSVAIDVTSSGSLASSPVSGTWSSGVSTFADLTHTATGTGLTLTTSNIDLTGVSSDAFDITEASGGGSSVIVDFETAGDLYTPSTTEGSGETDVFNRSNPNIGGNATYIWAAEDLTVTDPSITLDQIDVSGATGFTFSIDMLTPNTNDWDVVDELLITYSIDGGAYQNLMWVQSNDDGDDYNAPAALDLAFDGTGDDGEELPAITDDFGAGVGSNFEKFSTSEIALSGNSTLDIKLQFNGLTSTAEGIYLDNLQVDLVSDVTVDTDSEVTEGVDAEPTTIASTVDADGEEIQVFDFTFTDAGTSDGLATIIDEIQITQGSANDVADWTNAIAGAYLSGTDLGSDLAGTINSTNITFTTDDMISIADGGNETYSLKIYLKTDLSNITDNDNLEFALDYNNITADASGSSFGSGAPESGDANVA